MLWCGVVSHDRAEMSNDADARLEVEQPLLERREHKVCHACHLRLQLSLDGLILRQVRASSGARLLLVDSGAELAYPLAE